ncbi:hypothetical protein IV203_032111 [Nitzschia inconspicua]|uniref:Uncharacterized protein n=1 Tax=Nitzschia inconspicua TaxID=303405 RepID=A0A9K3LVN8_9STRA|nr:hypothetical protein IV203_032111 [Nitzschia inconspicua]
MTNYKKQALTIAVAAAAASRPNSDAAWFGNTDEKVVQERQWDYAEQATQVIQVTLNEAVPGAKNTLQEGLGQIGNIASHHAATAKESIQHAAEYVWKHASKPTKSESSSEWTEATQTLPQHARDAGPTNLENSVGNVSELASRSVNNWKDWSQESGNDINPNLCHSDQNWKDDYQGRSPNTRDKVPVHRGNFKENISDTGSVVTSKISNVSSSTTEYIQFKLMNAVYSVRNAVGEASYWVEDLLASASEEAASAVDNIHVPNLDEAVME